MGGELVPFSSFMRYYIPNSLISKHVLISPGTGIVLASGNFEINHKNNSVYIKYL